MAKNRIQAVIFDLDGLLLDSEVCWERARREFASTHGCEWREQDELATKGKNSPEWAQIIKERCDLDSSVSDIIEAVKAIIRGYYDESLPLLPGAVETVREVSARYPVAVASSSPPDLITFVLDKAGILDEFDVICSADTVGRGKPSPDVFLEAAKQLHVPPSNIAVFEDSTAGITAGVAAGMKVIAVPNRHFPASDEALSKANLVLKSLTDFRLEVLSTL